MKSSIWPVLLVLLILSSACGSSDPNEKLISGIKDQVIKNYEDNKTQFDKLDGYFKFNHIRYIEFLENNLVTIQWAIDSNAKKSDYQTLQNQGLVYDTVKKVLSLDNLTTDDLLEIKEHLQAINTNSLWLIDFKDEKTGAKTRGIELNYSKENTPFHFLYRHFEKPIEGKLVSDQVLIYKNENEEKLGNKTLWYYR